MIKRFLLLLFSIFSFGISYSHIISQELIPHEPDKNPVTLVLGDAHFKGHAAKAHAQLLIKKFEEYAKKDIDLYVSLEDRAWEPLSKAHDTLFEIISYAKKNNYKVGAVTFGAADCRPRALVWPLFFISRHLPSKTDKPNSDITTAQIVDWLQGIYGPAIPTARELVDHAKQFVTRIKQIRTTDVDLSVYIEVLEEQLKVIVETFQPYGNQSIPDVFKQWRQKPNFINMIQEIYSLLMQFMNAMAEVGFIVDYLEKKDQFDQVLFFVGHAHAHALCESLGDSLTEESHSLNRGPTEKFPEECVALKVADLESMLDAFSSMTQKRASRPTMMLDLFLFAMIFVGFGLWIAQPQRRPILS